MPQLRKPAPPPAVREELTYYRPREFRLSELEGFSTRSIELHLELYRAHVDNVNRLLAARKTAREPASPAEGRFAAQSRHSFAFEYNGMVLHELFFEGLTTALGTFPAPDGLFAQAAARSFGGIEAWKSDLRELARTRGPGWVLCALERPTQRIFNVWIDQHALGLPVRTDPILVIDLWEHAWIGDFQPTQRAEYVDMLLTQTDWQVVERRLR